MILRGQLLPTSGKPAYHSKQAIIESQIPLPNSHSRQHLQSESCPAQAEYAIPHPFRPHAPHTSPIKPWHGPARRSPFPPSFAIVCLVGGSRTGGFGHVPHLRRYPISEAGLFPQFQAQFEACLVMAQARHALTQSTGDNILTCRGARGGRKSLLLCQGKCHDVLPAAGPFCFCSF